MSGTTESLEPMGLDEPAALLDREEALRATGGPYRMRAAAAALGVPEGALIEARRLTGAARRLRRPDAPEGFGQLLAELPGAGEVMALTRNEACVHEKHGRFTSPQIERSVGQIVGEIDLRLFLHHWAYGYVLDEETRSGHRRSLQFFDASGTAIHKVYATAATDRAAFDRIAAAWSDADAAPARLEPAPRPEPDRADHELDRDGFIAAWDTLEHSHAFFGLLRRFGVGRLQAMRLGGSERARPVAPESARQALRHAADAALPIMIFVGNRGCVQIHSGPVERIEVMGPWLNVLDPRFNLHLREDRIAAAYVVRKPSVRGDVHSLEIFDADGICFCQIFGQRPPGGSERADWRALVSELPEAAPC